jgi:MFS family permease
MQQPDSAQAAHVPAKFPRYAVALLFVIYTLNFLDRQIINILAEPIKHDLELADWQLGAMTGLAFALFYTTLGLPIARLADRHHRGKIIAIALFVWSGFTALCGSATSFVQLLLFRIGVGMGEAGCSPAAQSLIGDITSKQQRARALSLYAMGIPIGSLLGMIIGGIAVDIWGWRHALVFVGAPGVLVALLALFTLKDPRANAASKDAATGEAEAVPTFREAARELASKSSFWWISIGTALTSFVGYGHQAFYASFFLRNHRVELASIADSFGLGVTGFLGIALGLVLGVGGSLGTYIGGLVTDRFIGRGPEVYAYVPAFGAAIAAPFFLVAFLLPSGMWAMIVLLVPTVFKNMWYGPVFSSIQSVVHQRSRATATAVFLFILNALGLGLGPIMIGALSDTLARSLGEAEGLRWAMIILTAVSLLAVVCFWKARKSIGRDQVQ